MAGYENGLQKEKSTNLNLGMGTLRDVDDLVTTDTVIQQTRQTDQRGNKLAHAKEVNVKTAAELKTLCEGLDTRITEIGVVVAEAQKYQGAEKFYSALGHLGFKWGKDKAAIARHERMQKLDLRQAVQEVQNYTVETIKQLGESEQDYKLDLKMYQDKLTEVLNKQSTATPPYLAIVAKRQELEAKVNTAKEELSAGTLSQAERPQKEQDLEAMERQLHEAQLQENSLLAIVKEAKEAIPDLQKDRDAAAESIKALHGMRQSMFEKFSNLKVVLERATTAMKATSRLELYSSVDPAFNKAIETITGNNIAAAGAALETYTDRIKHAAIDPQKSQEFLNELLGHMSDFAKELQDVEDGVKNNKKTAVPPANNDLN